MIYLDNAATTLVKPAPVYAAVQHAMETMASPGRGAHSAAMRAAELVLDCRLAAAEFFHVSEPEQVVFTMNATHALNIAITSLAAKGSRVLISGFEHNAVTRPLRALGAEIVTAGRTLFDADAVAEAFRAEIGAADLVVCTHVSNVFGFILPIYEIAGLCRERQVPRLAKAARVEIRERVQAELLRKSPAIPATYDLCWNLGDSTLLFFSTSKKAIALLEDLFKESFDLALVLQIPWLVGERMVDEAARPAYDNLQPAVFL